MWTKENYFSQDDGFRFIVASSYMSNFWVLNSFYILFRLHNQEVYRSLVIHLRDFVIVTLVTGQAFQKGFMALHA